MSETQTRSRLYDRARAHLAALDAEEVAASQRMLAAWSDAYWGLRQDLDTFTAWVDAQRAAGAPVSPSWVTRQQRFRRLIGQAQDALLTYGGQGAEATTDVQQRALDAAVADAEELVDLSVAETTPGLDVSLERVNPANLATAVGFAGDGTPLADLMSTIAPDGADVLRRTLARGLGAGWGQDRLVREFTSALAVSHSRAVRIMRTESLRVYRETTRATFAANADVVKTWTWTAALSARTCPACIAMHGTQHPVTETLDGHPLCRCAMVPDTMSWSDLGVDGMDDTGPSLEPGTAWFGRQSPDLQRAILGPRKYQAWRDGEFTLPEVVGRRSDPDWGTMRYERSLKSIQADRNPNPPSTTPAPTPPRDPSLPPALAGGNADLEAGLPTSGRGDARDAWRRLDDGPEAPEVAVKRANHPAWDIRDEFAGNCSNVATAYELRRRGYDVQALPIHRRTGRKINDIVAAWGVPKDRHVQTDQFTFESWAYGLPDGARGAICVFWKRGGGHIQNWEVRDGRIIFPEGQLEGGRLNNPLYDAEDRVQYWRWDDLPDPDLDDNWVENKP